MTAFAFSLTSLEGRYARTLYELTPPKDLEKTIDQGKTFWSLVQENMDLKRTLLTSLVHRDIQVKVAKKTLLAVKVSKTLLDFALLVIKKGRFDQFLQIINHVESMHHDAMGMMDITVAFGGKMSSSNQKEVTDFLEKTYGKNLHITFISDPHLIAGYRIHLPTKVLDVSFSKQLHIVQQNLLKGYL